MEVGGIPLVWEIRTVSSLVDMDTSPSRTFVALLGTALVLAGCGGGDTDKAGVSGLDCLAFMYFAELSGLVPIVGINAGYCFAGNAAILGCCDVVIATADSNIGMGGPAMIEGGGLGVFPPTEIGPMEIQRANGVVDIAVADEVEAVAVAKQYLGYFQGASDQWESGSRTRWCTASPISSRRTWRRPGARPSARCT